jgi:hypothetical protein
MAYRLIKDDDTLVILSVGNWNPSAFREFFDEAGLEQARQALLKQTQELVGTKVAEAQCRVCCLPIINNTNNYYNSCSSSSSSRHAVVVAFIDFTCVACTSGQERHWQS